MYREREIPAVSSCLIHTPTHQCLMGVFPVTYCLWTLFMTNLSACSSSDDLIVKYSLFRRKLPDLCSLLQDGRNVTLPAWNIVWKSAEKAEPSETLWHTHDGTPTTATSIVSCIEVVLIPGWHYLSNAICLMRPRSFYALFRCVNDHHNLLHYSQRLKNTCVRRVVLDKWFPLKLTETHWNSPELTVFTFVNVYVGLLRFIVRYALLNLTVTPPWAKPGACSWGVRVYIYIYIYIYIYVYIYIEREIHIYACIYIYIYIYIYTHCTYIYIYREREMSYSVCVYIYIYMYHIIS